MDISAGPSKKAVASLVMIGGVTDRIKRDTDLQRQYVAIAHKEGASWRMIGVALGTSGQAAWERFRPPEAPTPLPGQGGLF